MCIGGRASHLQLWAVTFRTSSSLSAISYVPNIPPALWALWVLSAFISACRFQLSLASNPGWIPWTPHPILCDPTEPQAWSVQNISKHQVNQVSIQTGHFTIKCNRHPFPNRIKSRRTCHIEYILFQIGSYKTCHTESIFFRSWRWPCKACNIYTPSTSIPFQQTGVFNVFCI